MIDWKRTERETGFGKEYFEKYPGSGRKVFAICDECGVGRWSQFKSHRNLCMHCSRIKEIELICDNCGKIFRRQRSKKISDKIFCCRQCQHEYQNKRVELICDNCGIIFTKPPSMIGDWKKHFCSNKCKGEYMTIDRIKLVCENCGETFTRLPSDVNNGKHFCSYRCRGEYQNKQIKITCDNCGKIFMKKPSQIGSSKNFCCRECGWEYQDKRIEITCDNCGKIFIRTLSLINSSKNFCSHKCSEDYQIGKNSPNYGLVRSEEYRESVSEGLIKYYKESPEALNGMSNRMIEYYEKNPNVKQLISIGLKKYFENNPDARKKISAIRQGIPYEKWPGFTDKSRPHLTPIHACIQLNQRFPGSEGHHIMSSVVIFIPRILHQSVRHNFKTGVGMNKINKIAFNFLLSAQW